jgi:hypothetical protein
MKLDSYHLLDKSQIVQVCEEFGRCEWLWHPDFPLDKLVQWWESQPSLGFIRVEEFLSQHGQCWCVEESDEPYEQAHEHYMQYGEGYYHLHLCCDEDSFLYDLDNKKIYHQGCTASEERKKSQDYLG